MTEVMDVLLSEHDKEVAALTAEIERLQAENERLRAELRDALFVVSFDNHAALTDKSE